MHLNKVILHPQKYPNVDYYPFNLNILQKTEYITFSTPVTFFAGENGAGKSTLLEAICCKCGIHIWEDVERIRYGSNPYEEELYKYIDVK